MKKLCFFLIFSMVLGLLGCQAGAPSAPILATTKPVYDFTSALCSGTELEVSLLINDSISCLHDYALSTTQMRQVEKAELVVISGAGLEDFADDLLKNCPNVADASEGIPLLECTEHHDHDHEADGHIWLSPALAKSMCRNICRKLEEIYPAYAAAFRGNLAALEQQLDQLQSYGEAQLTSLACRELITFHNGFAYLAQSFGLTILAAVEEEDGSMISSATRIELMGLIADHNIPAIFTETNGIADSAKGIAQDTGISVFVLDMCMSGNDYFSNMYHNIDTLKEALG